jgi:hypothetical protein
MFASIRDGQRRKSRVAFRNASATWEGASPLYDARDSIRTVNDAMANE